MDLISVIVPIYRVGEYVDQCIWSIRNQTYRNLEIILVDDGSDDQCPQICDWHAGQDERIKVIHKENGGLDSARKTGMLASNGKYVGYVDGDDWIEPEMYQKLLEYVQIYGVEVVESGVIDSSANMQNLRCPYIEEGCYQDSDFEKYIEPKLLYSGKFFEYGISPYLCSKLFLREKILKYQMMEGKVNQIQDDTMVGIPCIAETKSLYITHDCFYHYRIRRNSSKRKSENAKEVVADLFECYPGFLSRFEGTCLCSKDDQQLKYFAMYWLLMRAPQAFDSLYKDNFLVPFGNIGKGKKIVLYGAGAVGIHLERYIRSVANDNIVCWLDRNYKDLQEMLDVINPHEILHFEYDYVIISIMREKAVKSAKIDLINIGVPENKILWIEQKYLDNPDLLLSQVIYQGKSLIQV